jgi:hypothetical protein
MDKDVWEFAHQVFEGNLRMVIKAEVSRIKSVRLSSEVYIEAVSSPGVAEGMKALIELGIARRTNSGVDVLDNSLIGTLEPNWKSGL